MKTWKPVPIEEYFKDDPERLLIWKALGIEEEKRVPGYADEPIAKSTKMDMQGIYRTNFNPKGNLMQQHRIADALGISTLPVHMDKAFRKIIKHIKDGAS